MSTIKRSSTINLSNRIITIDNVVDMSNVLWEIKDKYPNCNMQFHVTLNDNSSIYCDDISVFQDDDIQKRQRTKQIIVILDCKEELFVKIQLTHGDVEKGQPSNSFIEFIGTKTEDLISVKDKLNKILDSLQEQHPFIKKYEIGIIIFTWALFAVAITSIMNANSDNQKFISLLEKSVSSWGDFLFFLLAGGLFGFIATGVFAIIFMWAQKLWPTIEIQIGPEHHQTEKIKRQKIGFLVASYILPIAMFVYGIYKSLS